MTTTTKALPTFNSLRACKKMLQTAISTYKRLRKRLGSPQIDQLEHLIDSLHSAVAAKNLEQARLYAQEMELFLQEHGKKRVFEHIKEFIIAIVVALAIAGVIRQAWFEPYEIPTGSMRPTFKEKDGVFALKNTFGINVPFETRHFLFEPDLVKRGSIVIITGDNLGFSDVDTTYFGIFPGKRRYVKRCVAKGGDTIYFYGGKIYGIDKEGNELEEAVHLEHIPFITFDGKVEQTMPSNDQPDRMLLLYHMNIPIGKISISPAGTITSQVPTPDGWMPEDLNLGAYPKAFFEFWGIGNFAISKLVTKEELPKEATPYTNSNAKLYLELSHTPTLPTKRTSPNSLLYTRKTWIPLDDAHCDAIKQGLYTARFIVKGGTAFHYTPEETTSHMKGIFLDKAIPDGCYEFFDGIAYQIGWAGISNQLPPSHPLYPQTIAALKTLYNSGIELYPLPRYTYPARYAYFRDGDLYTLGKKIFDKADPTLTVFSDTEILRQAKSPSYIAFADRGAPLDEGKIDAAFIKAFGLHIPENHYLLLGDNHAMSNDSRFIGAVPQQNIQGSPIVIFWPPGDRWGVIDQPSVPFLRAPNVIVLSLAAAIAILCYAMHRHRISYRYFTSVRR
ncbi:MAG: signal peptidase I [Verrucomicrobia bacterium]|nr:signal peptidase I [Verrucomicrobiota bacterium]